MFGGVKSDIPNSLGKKMFEHSSRRGGGQFSLGWSDSNQPNSYQIRKGKNKEITSKITTNLNQNPQENIRKKYYQHQSNNYVEPRLLQYEKLIQDNPDLAPEQLERILQTYNNQKKANDILEQSSIPQPFERRIPIRPRESMRDIIYSGIGIEPHPTEQTNQTRNSNPYRLN